MNIMTNMFKHCKSSKAKKSLERQWIMYDPLQKTTMKCDQS